MHLALESVVCSVPVLSLPLLHRYFYLGAVERKRINELDEDDDANGLKNNRLDVVREEAWRPCWLTV